jgi:hypothetical protein
MGGPFHMPAALALLAGIALFFAALFARLAVLAALLLLLTALFFFAIRLRLLLVLVGGISHFPSPCSPAASIAAGPMKNPWRIGDVPRFVASAPGCGGGATSG